MKDKFEIKIFNGNDPQSQYDNCKKDDNTLYILANGKIYLGSVPMGGDGEKTHTDKEIEDLIKQTLEELNNG